METRNYELMFILTPELGEEDLDSVLQRIQRYLESAEAEVFSFKSWGLRRLAYAIEGQREGRYYLVRFAVDPQRVNDLDRNLRLVEGNLRHLIVRMDDVEIPEETEEMEETEEVPAAQAEAEAELTEETAAPAEA